MDKFELALLAQLKEHNRLMKELVKIEQANFELRKDIIQLNSNLHWIYKTDTDGTISSRCSHCEWPAYNYHVKWNYCPNCGMKMSMEKEGEDDA